MRHILDFTLVAAAFVALGCNTTLVAAPLPPLVTGQVNVTALVGDGTSVYWSANGSVRSIPTGGGAVADLAQGLAGVSRLALDTDSVYWAAGGEISSVPKIGGATPQLLVQNEDNVGDLKVDADNVYWLSSISEVTSTASGQVSKAAKVPGASVQVLASDALDPSSLALAGESLYFPGLGSSVDSDYAGIRELATAGGTATTAVVGAFQIVATSATGATTSMCAAGPDAQALSLDPNSTAWAITCSALDGSNPNVVAAGIANPVTSVTLDDVNVYFGTTDGQLSAVALDGSAPISTSMTQVVAPDGSVSSVTASTGSVVPLATAPAGTLSIAVDSTSVYWASSNGDSIWAMSKL